MNVVVAIKGQLTVPFGFDKCCVTTRVAFMSAIVVIKGQWTASLTSV